MRKPAPADPCGANAFAAWELKLYVLLCGGGTGVEIKTTKKITLSLGIELTAEDFFDQQYLMRNLASLFGIPKERIRVPKIVAGSLNVDVDVLADDLCRDVDCGAHGKCANGTCTCAPGYAGAQCEQRVCPVAGLVVGMVAGIAGGTIVLVVAVVASPDVVVSTIATAAVIAVGKKLTSMPCARCGKQTQREEHADRAASTSPPAPVIRSISHRWPRSIHASTPSARRQPVAPPAAATCATQQSRRRTLVRVLVSQTVVQYAGHASTSVLYNRYQCEASVAVSVAVSSLRCFGDRM